MGESFQASSSLTEFWLWLMEGWKATEQGMWSMDVARRRKTSSTRRQQQQCSLLLLVISAAISVSIVSSTPVCAKNLSI